MNESVDWKKAHIAIDFKKESEAVAAFAKDIRDVRKASISPDVGKV